MYSKMSMYLQNAGFISIENQINVRGTRQENMEALEKYRSIGIGVDYSAADENDIQIFFSEMDRSIFSTDRISLDPYFGIKTANRRIRYG